MHMLEAQGVLVPLKRADWVSRLTRTALAEAAILRAHAVLGRALAVGV